MKSVDSKDSDFLVSNSVSSSVSNSVNKDVIDGMIITSRAPPSDKKKDHQGAMTANKKTTGDNVVMSTPSSGTKCVSLVSGLTFCSTSISISNALSLPSSKINPAKKKTKCGEGLKKKKCNTITNNTMDPYTGKLRCRLDRTLCHLPEQVKSEHVQCAMHSWLCKVKKRSQLMHCRACDINLCLDCYKPFHQIPNII